MRSITEANLTDAVLAKLAGVTDPRFEPRSRSRWARSRPSTGCSAPATASR